MTETLDKPQVILNDDQTKGLDTIHGWFDLTKNKRDNSIFFKLTGSAGTGKTTLIGVLLESITKHFKEHRVCICAPTHKAKKVIQNKTKWKNAETLQALLGMKLDTDLTDFDINNPIFSSIGERKIRDYDLVIIDESSMINQDLYTTIVECATQTGSRVIFAGDTKQLNPVKEYGISPSLITPEHGYNLTQIVRQADTNPLLNVLHILRDDIENNTNNYIQYLTGKPNDMVNETGYNVLDNRAFAERFSTYFKSQEFREDKNYCRYIAWTNNSIQSVNQYLREKVFLHSKPLVEGELLLAYKTILEGKGGNLLITNSDDYIVEKYEESKHPEYDFNIIVTTLTGVDTGNKSKLNILNKNSYEDFIETHNSLIHKAKYKGGGKAAWAKFFKFREQFVLLETLLEDKQLVTKKDIDYGYGITIHKSQGSTYHTVFVNGKDINRNINEIERKRLWYVALSRASNKAFIHI